MAGKKYIDMKDSDAVEYFLFPDLPLSSRNNEVNLQLVNEAMENIYGIVRRLSDTYIWHNEEFQISHRNLSSYVNSNGNDIEPFLFYGSLNYGENIEDEWFLVYILMELTKQIPGLLIRVKDSDGEFLLIEAAEHLPSWVTPETCEDKVFLYNGQLHILPKSYPSNQEEFTITGEVIQYIKQHSKETKASKLVQKAIRNKINVYPDKIEKDFHKTILYVPIGVASLLNAHPKFIAPAVRAFCERDLIDVKACRAMKFFPPENRVLTQVIFTRCLYAMLVSSKYLPDRRTGWNLPSPNDENYKSHLLGIKIACGFEILLSQAKSKDEKEDEVDAVDYSNDPNWKKFIKSLCVRNYFKGLLEHSKEYNQLLGTAKEFYKSSCESSIKPNKAKDIAETMDKLEMDVDKLKRQERNLPQSDDDSWMNITQKDLDSMLEARFGSAGQNDLETANGNPEVSEHLKTFINHMSGLDGAEFPKKETKTIPVRPKRGVKNKKRKSVKFSPDTKLHSASSIDKIPTANANRIHFEPDGFINAIQNILDFSIPDDNYWESDGSGMSSYEDETDMDLGEATKPMPAKRDADLLKYMDKMDEELSKTTMAKSFILKNTKEKENNKMTEDSFDDIESFKPVDIDLNALKNILSSYQAQMGEPGPAENLLGPLGVHLDDIDADLD